MSNLKPLIPGQYGSSSKEIKQNDLTMMVDEDVDVISKSMSNMGLHMSNTNPRISENAGKIFSSARKSTKEGIMAMLENGRKSVRKALAFEGTTMFDNDNTVSSAENATTKFAQTNKTVQNPFFYNAAPGNNLQAPSFQVPQITRSELRNEEHISQTYQPKPKQRWTMKEPHVKRLEKVQNKLVDAHVVIAETKWFYVSQIELEDLISSLMAWYLFYREICTGLFETLEKEQNEEMTEFLVMCNEIKKTLVNDYGLLDTKDFEVMTNVKEVAQLRSIIAQFGEDFNMYNKNILQTRNYTTEARNKGINTLEQILKKLQKENRMHQMTDEPIQKEDVRQMPKLDIPYKQVWTHQPSNSVQTPTPLANSDSNRLILDLLQAVNKPSGRVQIDPKTPIFNNSKKDITKESGCTNLS